MRTLEYWDIENEAWFDVEWSTVVSGMVVRMYEENGTPIPGEAGIYEMKVMADSYIQTISGVGDVWTINVLDNPPYQVEKTNQ